MFKPLDNVMREVNAPFVKDWGKHTFTARLQSSNSPFLSSLSLSNSQASGWCVLPAFGPLWVLIFLLSSSSHLFVPAPLLESLPCWENSRLLLLGDGDHVFAFWPGDGSFIKKDGWMGVVCWNVLVRFKPLCFIMVQDLSIFTRKWKDCCVQLCWFA